MPTAHPEADPRTYGAVTRLASTRELEEVGPDSVVDRRYVVKREIARGGMGGVFEAEHVVTRAKVALKTLTRPALDHQPAHARLMREARILGSIRHPNVVLVQDAGLCPKHGPFMALEMLDGRPLDGLMVARNTLPVGQAIAMLVQLCDALDSVHKRGIVHRDLKTSNIVISRTELGDQVELIDFGIAMVGKDDDVVAEKLTKMGELLGTIEYMSPEQLMATSAVDSRTDIYAAGVLMYECLVGEVPFSGSPTAVMTAIIQGQRPPPMRARRHDVPLELEGVIRRALEIDPSRRFQSAKDFANACAAAFGGSVPKLHLLDVSNDRNAPPPLPTAVAAAASDQPPEAVLRRRQFVRAPYVTPVRIVLGVGNTVDGRSEDISEGGLLIVTDTECAQEQQVRVRFPLPTSGRVVQVDALTRWVKTRRNQRAIGLEFQNAPADVRTEIRAYAELMSGVRSAV
jgi:serine/threonine protein kinase